MKSQVSNYSARERLRYLEFVIAWLEEHRRDLSALSYRRLRQAARRQLAALQARRTNLAGGPARAERPRPAPSGLRTRRELALVGNIRAALQSWVAAGALTPAAAERLDRQLGRHSEDLKLELAGQAVCLATSVGDMLDYALECLPEWSRAAALDPAERLGLAVFLRNQR